jgi:ABC-2 type transport system permease protein
MTATDERRTTRRQSRADAERWSLGAEVSFAFSDAMAVTWRNLLHTIRVKQMITFLILQPIVFVLLLSLVFGGAIALPGGGSYREYLMAGVFAQSVAFTTYPTALGTAFDVHLGLMDRFRTLPMHPAAIFVGRTTADLTRMMISIAVMGLCGLAVGWRINDGVLQALAGFGLLLMFGFAMSWIGAYIGLACKTLEAVQSAGLMWLFPVTFVSSAFVPTQSMPEPLETFAEWNPVSAVAAAARELFGNPNPFAQADGFPADHPILLSVLWSVALVGIFATLCARKFRKAAA